MTARSRTAILAGLATAFVLVGSALIGHGFGLSHDGSDFELYARYAHLVLGGSIPYRDFFIEYPPGALAALVPPGLGNPSLHAYATRFSVLMAVALGLAALACAGVLTSCRAPRERFVRTLALIALCPLLLGPIALKRFDAVPALLTVVVLLLAVRRRLVPSAFVLGIAAAVKIYPLVLLPFLVAAALGRSRRAAMETVVSFLAAVAVCFLPFVMLSPGGMETSIRSQLDRHLQIETTFSSIGLLAHVVGGVSVGVMSEAHTYALGGSRGALLGALATLTLVAGLLLVWWRSPRLVRSPDGLVLAFAATTALVVAFSRVLSPQFLLWLVPLVPLVRGSVGRLVTALLAAALVLTNIWFPDHYGEVFRTLDAGSILLLFARNALLVTIAVVLVVAVWRLPEQEPA